MSTTITIPANTGQTWTQVRSFWIPGTPITQIRPHPRVKLTGPISQFKYVRSFKDVCALVRGDNYQESDDKTTKRYAWKHTVMRESGKYVPDFPLEGPVRVDATFYLPRPKYMDASKYSDGPIFHDKVGDRDNFDKLLTDPMSDVNWWKNDGQICSGLIEKFYHGRGGAPGVDVQVWALEKQAGLFGGGE